MSIGFGVYKADRKSKCRLCGQGIVAGEIVVQAHGYKTASNVHVECIFEAARNVM